MSTEPKEAAPMPALVERLREMYAAAYPAGQNDRTDLGKERFALAFAAVNALPGLLDRIASLEAEVAALRKVITDHNIGCQQSCDARAESESCNRFHGYQRACSDCPVDWVIPSAAIDSAIAAKGK